MNPEEEASKRQDQSSGGTCYESVTRGRDDDQGRRSASGQPSTGACVADERRRGRSETPGSAVEQDVLRETQAPAIGSRWLAPRPCRSDWTQGAFPSLPSGRSPPARQRASRAAAGRRTAPPPARSHLRSWRSWRGRARHELLARSSSGGAGRWRLSLLWRRPRSRCHAVRCPGLVGRSGAGPNAESPSEGGSSGPVRGEPSGGPRGGGDREVAPFTGARRSARGQDIDIVGVFVLLRGCAGRAEATPCRPRRCSSVMVWSWRRRGSGSLV